jgi:hypothetical protein
VSQDSSPTTGEYSPPGDIVNIQQARRRHEDALLNMTNVTGVGTSTDDAGRDVIVVFVTRKVPSTHLAVGDVPEQIEGFPVRVVEIGSPAAQR